MSALAFWLIIGSAVLHASWNLLAKKSHMTLPFYATICLVSPLFYGHVLFWTPVPLSELSGQFWATLCGTVASDVTYCFGLIMTYRYFDMSVAYPVMRSLPILLTALLTWILGIGKVLSPLSLVAMVVVFCGCMMMPLVRFRDFSVRQYLKHSMIFVLMAALGTTGYTLGDSEGLRIIREVAPEVNSVQVSLTYYPLRSLMLVSVLWTIVALVPKFRKQATEQFHRHDWTPLLAGTFAVGTYTLVLIAMNHVDNPSYVQVLRQMGLPIGMALGMIILHERCTWPKIIGVILILTGLALTML